MTQNFPSEPEKMLTIKQRQAALLLAGGSTIEVTAREVGVSEKTVDIWKKKPLFQEEVRQAENKVYDESLRMLKRNAKDAINCLIRNMGGKVSPYVQVSAAGKLLDLGMDMYKITEVLDGLNELRRRLDDADKR